LKSHCVIISITNHAIVFSGTVGLAQQNCKPINRFEGVVVFKVPRINSGAVLKIRAAKSSRDPKIIAKLMKTKNAMELAVGN